MSEQTKKKFDTFKSFDISKQTLNGLKEAGFSKPTLIQRRAIPPALKGEDVLGAAKTGSGKTLAFIVPVLECLKRLQFSAEIGLGALIITPTRELAYQIFQVVRDVGKYHEFSAALVIGGKDYMFELSRMCHVNIVICTPGRLLQHMDQNSVFDCASLEILVVDEADRILDMGFKATLDAILANLPPDKQTLLFSATQTTKVEHLSRLALKSPRIVFPHQLSQTTTPKDLQQMYIICDIREKLSLLYSFIKGHLKCKILVFLSTCKQVKFVFETFSKFRPGVSLLQLQGNLHQLRRMEIYRKFCRKQFVVLFATDIASRGLDFPGVDWVVQVDCAEDVKTYIHRVGRTARKGNKLGSGVMFLLDKEVTPMLQLMQQSRIPIEQTEINPNKVFAVKGKLQSLLAGNVELHATAKKAFISYVKHVYMSPCKQVFDVKLLDLDGLAESLGLIGVPRLRFLKNKPFPLATANKEAVMEKAGSDLKSVFSSLNTEKDEGDVLVAKERTQRDTLDVEIENTVDVLGHLEQSREKVKIVPKLKRAKGVVQKGLKLNTHIVFTAKVGHEEETALDDHDNSQDGGEGLNIHKMQERMKVVDKFDRRAKKTLVKQQKEEENEKRRRVDGTYLYEGRAARLGGAQLGADEDSESDYACSPAPDGQPTMATDVFDFDALAHEEDKILNLFND